MRQARYCGRHKTLFQALATAAVANLTLIAGKVSLWRREYQRRWRERRGVD